MLYPIKVLDIELSRPLSTIENLDGYMGVQTLVRLHGVPIGYVKAPITNGHCTAQTLSKLILEQHSWAIIQQLLCNGLAAQPKPEGLCLEDLFDVPPPKYEGDLPLVTIAVCTRDRTTNLALCLDAISRLDYPHLDILVVDNAPTSNGTKELVQTKYPKIRYVCEPRPGLDWARNRAIIEAKGEIIAYTDDDVVVDSGWVKALAQVFAENPEVMAVTGLVVPYELETEAQVLFEMYGGFGKGFERKWYRVAKGEKVPWHLLGTGKFGTGANMAYRRCVFEEIGYFDPALDVGTVTNGGGDLEMFFRVLKLSHTLVYEPKAIVRHRHRREYESLQLQIKNNGIGLYSYFVCCAKQYPDLRISSFLIGIWWLLYWSFRRLWIAFKHPIRLPVDLIWNELKGSLIGLTKYQQSCKKSDEIVKIFGSSIPEKSCQNQTNSAHSERRVAVITIDLSHTMPTLTELGKYSDIRVFVTLCDRLLGSVNIANSYYSVSQNRLIEAIVSQLGLKVLASDNCQNKENDNWHKIAYVLEKNYKSTEIGQFEGLLSHVKVSINLATYDRPEDLRNCLRCLLAQKTARNVEIIVVDNHPSSGMTPPVVAEFPGVILVSEPRQGLAYARNTGFVNSTGEIVIATDDDVTQPPDWLEKLIAPFARPDVMVVTGNVLPLELETYSQQFFENYGGLGRGFTALEVNGDWFESFPRTAVPTWRLGATANAAFRTTIFSHSQIGLMQETLGPGMPSGVGEDTYLFYKVLKAGYTHIYEPNAYVWHKHRKEPLALRRQLYGYSKGHVAYNLITYLQDKDLRGLIQILVGLPIYHGQQLKNWLLRRSNYPLSLIVIEIVGNLAGPWSLWRSRLRVRREGRSVPYISLSQRTPDLVKTNSQKASKLVRSN
ncbi:glycosyltransferase family 2 protein [Nostoc sp. CALU 1950]|uniref:glycosyltransferase family 2 protein n=1 Tax=Nostoc sp. CALU 1950 TaxID=3104321 RepID=UPI003EC0FDA1